MKLCAYRNRNTNDTVVTAGQSARLEGLDNWERLEGKAEAKALEGVDTAAYERAAAEKASIELAAGNRAAIVDAEGLGKAAAAKVAATSQDSGTTVITSAHSAPQGVTPAEGVLARARADAAEGRTQTGPNPEDHPHTKAELETAAENAGDTPVLDRPFAHGKDPKDETGGGEQPPAGQKPSTSALKPELVDYAVQNVGGMTREKAESMTRQQLIEAIG